MKNSSSLNGGNGIIYDQSSYLTDFLKISFDEKHMYSKDIYLKEINQTWALIFGLNYLFKNKTNDEIINVLDSHENNKCKNSNVHDKFYWKQIIQLCIENNINIQDNTEVLSYHHINDNKIQVKTKSVYLTCNKLIICTANNTSLINHFPEVNLIQCISGLSFIIKVRNKLPDCFHCDNGFFIAPYSKIDSLMKVCCHLEIGYDKGNYIIDEKNPEYLKVVEFILSQPEVQKYHPTSIVQIWRGTRAVTYDTLPFFTKIENNVYWFTGGSFSGCRVAPIFSKYFVNFISDKEFFLLPKTIDPTINRLISMRQTYLLIISIVLFLIIRKVYYSVRTYTLPKL
jgi:hypothetical protein